MNILLVSSKFQMVLTNLSMNFFLFNVLITNVVYRGYEIVVK